MRLRATTRALPNLARPEPRALLAPSAATAAAATAQVGSYQPRSNFFTPSRREAQLRNTLSDVVEFSASKTRLTPEEIGLPGVNGPPDERTLKLGKTLRILQSRLPSVLASPLPNEILSPHISLHLFPSTHPHLPNVSGKVAYHAALWTSPITWGRVPLIGNVRLHIVSERMVKHGPSYHTMPTSEPEGGSKAVKGTPMGEKLIVRWKACGKENGSQVLGKMTEWLGRETSTEGAGGFEGLFIFEFDEEGRVLSHTIERAEQGSNWDQGVGKWVGLTDWLLGRLGRREEAQPGLALGYIRDDGDARSRFGRK